MYIPVSEGETDRISWTYGIPGSEGVRIITWKKKKVAKVPEIVKKKDFNPPPSHWSSRGTIWWWRPYKRDRPMNFLRQNADFWIYQISSYKCHLAVEDHFLARLYSHVGHHGIINPRRTARLDWKIQSASQTKDCDLNLEQFVFWKCVWYEFCCCQCGNVCWYDMRGFLWANTFPQLEKFVVTFILSWDGPWSNKGNKFKTPLKNKNWYVSGLRWDFRSLDIFLQANLQEGDEPRSCLWGPF